MLPVQDLREFAGVKVKEQARFDPKKYAVEVYMAKGMSRPDAEKAVARDVECAKFFRNSKMIEIPNQNFENFAMLSTVVTKRMYDEVMGEYFWMYEEESNAEVLWTKAIYFCNKLSERFGYTPVYAVYGKTDVSSWGSINNGHNILVNIEQN